MKTCKEFKITRGVTGMKHSKTVIRTVTVVRKMHFKMRFLCNNIKMPHKNKTRWI